MRERTFFVSEIDLSSLEDNLSLIYSDGMDWSRFNNRPDLAEAWAMTIKTLSDIRFSYGPPSQVGEVGAEGEKSETP